MNYTLAIDQGTHASRALVLDAEGRLIARSLVPVLLVRPAPERAEQDARQIVASVQSAVRGALHALTTTQRGAISSCGITTQRSTVLAWQPDGTPLSAAINWQDTRGRPQLASLRGRARDIQRISGLPLSAHYGASKLHWLHQLLANKPDTQLGPLASFLLKRLLDQRGCCVDHSNAQRMQLFDIHELDWSRQLTDWFDVPVENLPRCHPIRHDYGELAGHDIPVTALCGDQNAAWFGSGEPDTGTALVNLGSGAFILTRKARATVLPDLLSSIVYSDRNSCHYVLEGTVNGAGNALQWLATRTRRNDVQEKLPLWLAQTSDPPLFLNTVGGLGSPWWKQGPVAKFVPDTDRLNDAERATAVAESILFLVQYNLEQILQQQPVARLLVSGGLSQITPLCQKLADLSGLPVARSDDPEASARGAAWLAAGQPDNWQPSRPLQHFAPAADKGLRKRYTQCIERLCNYIDSTA